MFTNIYKIINSVFFFAKNKILLIFFLFFISLLLETIGVSMVVPIISVFIESNSMSKYLWTFNFINENTPRLTLLLYLIFFFSLILILKYIVSIIIEILLVKYTKSIEVEINSKILEYQFFDNPLKIIHDKKDSGNFSKLILTDVPVFVFNGLLSSLHIIKNLFIILLFFFLTIFSAGFYPVFFLVFIIIIFLSIYKILKTKFSFFSIDYNNKIYNKHQMIIQFIKGFKIIKINILKKYFIDQFSNNEKEIIKFDVINKLFNISPKIVVEMIFIFSVFGFILINFHKGSELVPIIGLLAFIIYRTQPLIVQVSSSYSTMKLFKEQITTIEKNLQFIKQLTSNDFPKNDKVNMKFKNASKIYLKNVSFSYKDKKSNSEKKILDDVNLELEFNKIYGLRGDNGSGKSTFADLISTYLAPQKGRILLDDQNIHNQDINWRKYIAYLDQNFFLFDATIRNNITLEKFNNKIFNKDRYNQVIQITNLEDFISSFPEKDEKYLSGFEKNISGGQKQKLCLARCLYQSNKVLILDEPTSALDLVSANIFKNNINQIKKDKLVILITHDVSILNICDHVMEIKDRNILKY
jgi:ABC-type bacteriocin/lantibiotic exporter with double-glycine peptidase domain